MIFEVMWYGGIVLGSICAIACMVLFVKNHIPSVILYLSRTRPVRYQYNDGPEQSGRIPLQVGRSVAPTPVEDTELLATMQLQEELLYENQPNKAEFYPAAPSDPNSDYKWQ